MFSRAGSTVCEGASFFFSILYQAFGGTTGKPNGRLPQDPLSARFLTAFFFSHFSFVTRVDPRFPFQARYFFHVNTLRIVGINPPLFSPTAKPFFVDPRALCSLLLKFHRPFSASPPRNSPLNTFFCHRCAFLGY